jgi:hypothetical protein
MKYQSQEFRDWDNTKDNQPKHLRYKCLIFDAYGQFRIGDVFVFCEQVRVDNGNFLYVKENATENTICWAECENNMLFKKIIVDELSNEGVLFNEHSRLEYKISEQKNSIYDKQQRRFEINIFRKRGTQKVMHLPEENFIQFLKDMKYKQ